MRQEIKEYDAVVVGSGPNGLSAAILLKLHGLSVLLLEGKKTIGGGLRTEEVTLPGFHHDICSAVHPLAVASPFFEKLPLDKHGLDFIFPEICAAHPFDDGSAAVLQKSIQETARLLGQDQRMYTRTLQPLLADWPQVRTDVLAPLHVPKYPTEWIRFGWQGLTSAISFTKRFSEDAAKGLFAGMAGHSMLPLSKASVTAFALVLLLSGHDRGWPLPKGGSQSIARALASYFVSLGGKIETDRYISSFAQLPSSRALLLDVTPRQVLSMAGNKLSGLYAWQLSRYRYGMGVFKMDWALDGPIPFTSESARKAGTVHLGGTMGEIAFGEKTIWQRKHAEKPLVLLVQPTLFDSTRAPEGKHVAWAYCHVPNGSENDMSGVIERQIERFAPGFRTRILARHTMNSGQMEAYNPNYIGGDINGGVIDLRQLFTRPVLRLSPYRTSMEGVYLCSASTPPSGGVHGLCGYYAGKRALRDVFNIKTDLSNLPNLARSEKNIS